LPSKDGHPSRHLPSLT